MYHGCKECLFNRILAAYVNYPSLKISSDTRDLYIDNKILTFTSEKGPHNKIPIKHKLFPRMHP